jgi:hypothetical protein
MFSNSIVFEVRPHPSGLNRYLMSSDLLPKEMRFFGIEDAISYARFAAQDQPVTMHVFNRASELVQTLDLPHADHPCRNEAA